MDPSLIDLPKFLDLRGNLSFIEEDTHIPFKIKRVYWIYDVRAASTVADMRSGRRKSSLLPFRAVLISGYMTAKLHTIFHLTDLIMVYWFQGWSGE